MTKTMTVPLFARIDTETNSMLNEMSKNSDKAKVVRLAIQTLYNQWPIVNVPMKRLSEFDQIHAQERQQADE
jgi:hypothetical protein